MGTEKTKFQDLIAATDKPILVDVFSENCGPCHAMKPVLEELKTKLGDDVRIIKIDGYKNMQFMEEFKIQAFPTLMLFHKGKMVWSRMGFTTLNILEQAIKTNAVA